MEFNLIEIFEKAPLANQVILIAMMVMSLWMVYLAIDRFLAFRKGTRETYAYVLALREALEKGRVDDALAAAKRYGKSPVAKVVEAGLLALQQRQQAGAAGGGDAALDVIDAVDRAQERVKEREAASLRKGLGSLASIASTSPFIGLLGTVIGIIGAFAKLGGSGGFKVVGPSIAEALVATAAGLFIAIPAAMLFNYYTGRVEVMTVDMNDISSEIVDFVAKESR